MKLVKSTGNLTNRNFNGYTFMSPYLEILQDDTVQYITQESIVECRDINYGIFAAIAIAAGLVMRSDNIISRTLKLLSNALESKTSESVYVEMDSINTAKL